MQPNMIPISRLCVLIPELIFHPLHKRGHLLGVRPKCFWRQSSSTGHVVVVTQVSVDSLSLLSSLGRSARGPFYLSRLHYGLCNQQLPALWRGIWPARVDISAINTMRTPNCSHHLELVWRSKCSVAFCSDILRKLSSTNHSTCSCVALCIKFGPCFNPALKSVR